MTRLGGGAVLLGIVALLFGADLLSTFTGRADAMDNPKTSAPQVDPIDAGRSSNGRLHVSFCNS